MSIQDEISKLISDGGAAHKRLIEYVIRQLGGGRALKEILDDPYVTNRANDLGRRALLEEPQVIEAAGDDVLADLRAQLDSLLNRA